MSTSLRPPAPAGAQRSVFDRSRPGSRLERSRAAAGLAVVCALALGLTACSLKDAKAEASVSASASALMTKSLTESLYLPSAEALRAWRSLRSLETEMEEATK